MKVVHIITGLSFGGAEKLLIHTANLQIAEHSVHIIYLKDLTKLKDKLNPNIQTHFIPLSYSCAAQIRSLLKTLNPDIIHTHLDHADLIGLWAARGLRAKLFCTMHNIWFKWNNLDYLIFIIYWFFFKTIARKCKVICISKSVQDHVVKRLGVNEDRSVLLYNAIPALTQEYNKAELRAKYQINAEDIVLLFVGRLRIQKSANTLLHALSLINNKKLRLIILGEGPLKNNLIELSHTLGISSFVEFRGVSHQPEEYFELADIFVLPSVFEGLGLVVLEAFRSKVPSIVSNIEGPKELIEHNENGLLFEPLDYKQLAKNIEYLIDNPLIRKKLGLNGFIKYKNNYEMSAYVNKLFQLYLN